MIILQDTREQQPLKFPKNIVVHSCKLDTADYSVIGSSFPIKSKYTDEDLDYLLCIERKKCPSEIFSNFTKPRFKDCMQRMSIFRHKYLLMEFSFDSILTFPVGSSVPKSKWKYLKVKPQFIISCISSMSIRYGIQPIFAGDSSNASYIATEIMKRVYKLHIESVDNLK